MWACCAAAKTARALQIRTLCLTGEDGGALASLCDHSIRTPARETYRIQEYHLPIYHALCAQAEALLFPEEQR